MTTKPDKKSSKTTRSRGSEVGFLTTVRKLLKIPLAVFGLTIILIVVICAVFSPWVAPYSYKATDADNSLSGATWQHPLGTDQLGRDTLSRIIYGSRVALLVSVGAVGFAVVVGTCIGLISANARGWLDEVLMRIMDAIVSIPSLIIAVGLISVMGSGLKNVIIAIGIAHIPWIARVVRSQALSVRERDFIEAARSIGASNLRIIFRHLWPNSFAPVIFHGTLGMAYAVLTEAAMGFLGLSVQPPTPTWGSMLQYAFRFIDYEAILSIAPGMAIFVLVLAFNFVGDALRDVLDPRLRGLFH